MVINGLCPTWPPFIHSFFEEVLHVCSEPESVLGFRGEKGELDPLNVLRMFCIPFLFDKEIVDEIKIEELLNYCCLL